MSTSMRLALCVAAAAVFASGAGRVFAQVITYTNAVANGEWSSAGTWSGGVPSDSLPAAIDDGFNVSLNTFGNLTNLLDVGTASGETGVLTMTDGDLSIFDSATGAGNEPDLPSIRIGQAAGSTGTFNLNGGLVTIAGATPSDFAIGDLIVGDVGNGTMTQTGGALSAADEIIIGLADGSTGVVSVSGGDFRADGRSILVGFDGNGTLNVSGTGNVRANFDLLVGFLEGGVGNVNLSGGTIEAGFVFTNSFTGPLGSTATITQTGGTFETRVAFVLGQSAGTTTMNHSGGAINAPTNNGDMVVGDGNGNTSTYNMSGTATVTVLHNFFVGAFEGSNGIVNQTAGTVTAGDNLFIGRDGNGVWNMNGGTNNATNVFLGDFDSSNGTLNIQGGTLNLTGNLNVGAALASNAAPDRVEPNGTNGAQGQALDANGTLNIIGTGGTINVAGNFLANPDDKSPARNNPGEENDATLKFTLGSTGISTIDVNGMADVDGAVIDIDDSAGFFAANPAAQLILMDVAGGFTNVTTVTPAEQVVGPAGAGQNFTLAAGDAGQFNVQIITGPGGGEQLVVSATGGGGFSADFDNDGDVDGADLTVWRNNFGPTDADGDADGDGDSDGNDFLTWQRQVGSGPATPAASAIPEPSAALLLGLAVAAFAVRRRC